MGAQEEGKQQMFSPSAETSGKYTCSVHLVFILLVFKFSCCAIHMSTYSHIVRWHFKLGIDNFVPPVPFLILNGAIKFLSNHGHCQTGETGFL